MAAYKWRQHTLTLIWYLNSSAETAINFIFWHLLSIMLTKYKKRGVAHKKQKYWFVHYIDKNEIINNIFHVYHTYNTSNTRKYTKDRRIQWPTEGRSRYKTCKHLTRHHRWDGKTAPGYQSSKLLPKGQSMHIRTMPLIAKKHRPTASYHTWGWVNSSDR